MLHATPTPSTHQTTINSAFLLSPLAHLHPLSPPHPNAAVKPCRPNNAAYTHAPRTTNHTWVTDARRPTPYVPRQPHIGVLSIYTLANMHQLRRSSIQYDEYQLDVICHVHYHRFTSNGRHYITRRIRPRQHNNTKPNTRRIELAWHPSHTYHQRIQIHLWHRRRRTTRRTPPTIHAYTRTLH